MLKDENTMLNTKTDQLVSKILSLKICNKNDRRDVKQNVYLKVLLASDTYVDQGKLKNWISVIARNEAISFLRQVNRWRKVKSDSDVAACCDDVDAGLDSHLVLLQAYDNFIAELQLAKIDQPDFDILEAYFIRFESKRSIARERKIPVRTVSRIITFYAQKIRQNYLDMCDALLQQGVMLK